MLNQNQTVFLKHYVQFLGISFVVVVSCVMLFVAHVLPPRLMGIVWLSYMIASFLVLRSKLKQHHN